MLAISFADSNFTQEKIESYEYTPWGVFLTSASKNNLLYTAREFDFETGLQFNRNRYYISFLGRFNIKDAFYKDFKYGKNNPTNYLDPWGLYSEGTSIFGSLDDYWEYCDESYIGCINKCYADFPDLKCFEEYHKCRENCVFILGDVSLINFSCLNDCYRGWQACIEVDNKNSIARRNCILDCISSHIGCIFRPVNKLANPPKEPKP